MLLNIFCLSPRCGLPGFRPWFYSDNALTHPPTNNQSCIYESAIVSSLNNASFPPTLCNNDTENKGCTHKLIMGLPLPAADPPTATAGPPPNPTAFRILNPKELFWFWGIGEEALEVRRALNSNRIVSPVSAPIVEERTRGPLEDSSSGESLIWGEHPGSSSDPGSPGDGVDAESSPRETSGLSGPGNVAPSGRRPLRLMKWSRERLALVNISPPPRNWLRNSCLEEGGVRRVTFMGFVEVRMETLPIFRGVMNVFDLFGFTMDAEEHHEELVLFLEWLSFGAVEFLEDWATVLVAEGVHVFQYHDLDALVGSDAWRLERKKAR